MLTQIPKPIMILVKGSESLEFLQNIVTNDLNKCDKKQHNFILTPQGKIKYEIYIAKNETNEFLVECSNDQNNILEYFSKYAELSDVNLKVKSLPKDLIYNKDYLSKSLSMGIVDTNFQQTDKFYPSEISNNAIDYEKGCYVGQEVVSRMKHRQLNKNLVRVFKKITLIGDFLEKRIENFEILSEYEDYLIVKYKADIEEFYLYYNKDFYELMNQNI
jgi:folate-binding protein YgfZ